MPIVAIHAVDPMVDGRQSARASEIRRGLARYFRELGIATIPEFGLASGRRADLIGIDSAGRIVLVEIKSSIEDFRSDSKWPEYLAFCDRFFFATHPEVPHEIFPAGEGLIVADGYGADMLRDSAAYRLAGATRKALLLRFARAAALRLDRVVAHHETTGLMLPAGLDSDTDDGAG